MINYAHRGASSYAPENTFISFELGIEMKADGIETDVRKTKDNILVLFHDDTLERILGRTESIEDYSYEELYAFDFGAFKGPQFKGEKIVRFDEFLERYGNTNLTLAIEIKGKNICKDIVDMIHRFKVNRYVVTSFDYSNLMEVHQLDPEMKLGFLTDCFSFDLIDKVCKEGITEICPKAEMMSPRICEYAHSKGLSVRAWGVKDFDLMMHSCLCGVDGMTVNFPDLLTAYLEEKGVK